MGRKLDLKNGDIFGRLELINIHVEKTKYGYKGLWKCLCGKENLYINSKVVSGHTNSCGCYRADRRIEVNTVHGHSLKHNESSEYRTWQKLKDRCLNTNNPDYHYYGGRGIAVCEEWKNSFEQFLKDMGNKPSIKHSIDRKNNELGYSKENCHWVLQSIQINNRRNTIKVFYNDTIYSLKQVCNLLNLKYASVLYQYNKNQILPNNIKKYENI
jgi:hypothetical protein